MLRSFVFRGIVAAVFGMTAAISRFAAQPQKQDSAQDKHLDIQSSAGDLHVGNDADARKAGLPLYPGARVRRDEENSTAANLSGRSRIASQHRLRPVPRYFLPAPSRLSAGPDNWL